MLLQLDAAFSQIEPDVLHAILEEWRQRVMPSLVDAAADAAVHRLAASGVRLPTQGIFGPQQPLPSEHGIIHDLRVSGQLAAVKRAMGSLASMAKFNVYNPALSITCFNSSKFRCLLASQQKQ